MQSNFRDILIIDIDNQCHACHHCSQIIFCHFHYVIASCVTKRKRFTTYPEFYSLKMYNKCELLTLALIKGDVVSDC